MLVGRNLPDDRAAASRSVKPDAFRASRNTFPMCSMSGSPAMVDRRDGRWMVLPGVPTDMDERP